LASGRGLAAGAVDIAALPADAALAAGATTETGRPFPDAEDFAVGSVMVVPSVAAHVASVEAVDVASTAAHVASVVVADVASVAAHVASVEAVDVASAAAHVASVAVVDVASAAAVDVASVAAVDVASVAADVHLVGVDIALAEAEVEAVPTVVGADRLHH